MGDIIDILKFFVEADSKNISFIHITIAILVTVVVYFLIYIAKKYIQKLEISFSLSDFLVECGIAFILEFILIWLYGPKVFILAIILGFVTALYVRNKLFSFIESNSVADHDLQLRMELAELKTKFKNNPYYSILEVLLYYGYISSIQKETVESENIFKTPDEMAKEFLSKPILTEDQLDEAIGIMNVIRREGKILTREEALLLIMNMGSDVSDDSINENSDFSVGE